ncbi:CU044_2847 family protein [Microtetraspora malaysiensis]|uniref:CU044_2847 family protein n=1 Tax=Microtetraspora malaysiensis TaxID=161358 RepID=A0ABW6T227_9ACTN
MLVILTHLRSVTRMELHHAAASPDDPPISPKPNILDRTMPGLVITLTGHHHVDEIGGGMQTLVAMQLGNVEVFVEAVPVPGSEPTSALDNQVARTKEMFGRAQEVIEQVAISANEIRERISKHARKPDQIEVQFGLKFSAQGHIIVASASLESSLTVKIVYGNTAASSDE